MSEYFPTEFGEAYWAKSRWIRVGSTIASSPAVLFMGGYLNLRGMICTLPFIWSSIHLVLIFRKVILHPMLNACLDFSSIAILAFLLSFQPSGLAQAIFRFTAFPLFLVAMGCFGLSCLREVLRYRREPSGIQLP